MPLPMKYILPILILCLSSMLLPAQDRVWTLNECIEYARENNITVQQSRLNLLASEYNLSTSKMAMWPSLNASIGHFVNFGRTVDPTTYTFISGNFQSSSTQLFSSVTLFGGRQITNTVRGRELDREAASAGLEAAEMDIAIIIAQAYLGVLLADENLGVMQQQERSALEQRNVTERLVQAGSLPEGSLMEAQAQLAQARLRIAEAQNQADMSLLNLQLTMLLEPASNFSIAKPTIDVDPTVIDGYESPAGVYSFALQNHPAMRSARASERSAETGLEIARGNYYPNLSLSGGIGSNASSTRRLYSQQITGIDTIGLTLPSQELVVIPRFSLFAEEYPYGSQLRDNFNQTLSINLSIPIFNNRRVRNAVDQARISHQLVGLQMRQQENQLRDAVYRAYQSALAAARQFDAAQENAVANRMSFDYISRRAEQGLVRAVDFNMAQNSLSIAESTLLQAKYQYVLSLKILDFYMGKPITLN